MDVYSVGIDEAHVFTVGAPGVLTNDPGGVGARSAVQLTNTAAGTAVLSSDGSFTYNPGLALRSLNAGESSIQEFAYRVSDAGDGTTGNPATVQLTVNGLNDQVTATNLTQSLTYAEDGGVRSLGVMSVDDPDVNDQITATLRLSDVTAGTLAAPGGTFNAGTLAIIGTESAVNSALAAVTFAPANNYDRNLSIQVTVVDGLENGTTAVTGTITFTVSGTNQDTPSANSIVVSVNEDSIANQLVLQGTDPDTNPATPLTFSLVGGALNGTISLVNAVAGIVSYTPTANYYGPDSFTFRVTDSTGLQSNLATVNVTVSPVNDVPSFTIGGNQTVTEDPGPQSVGAFIPAFSAGPANEAGQALSFIVVNNNSALFSVQPAIDTTGRLTYTPALDANGVATVTVQIRDDGTTNNGGVDTSAAQSFTITITSINDGPVATSDAYSTSQDTQLVVAAGSGILVNDSDLHGGTANENNVPLSAILVTTPAHGTLALSANGAFTYSPTPGYGGPDSFTYQAADSLGARSTTTTVNMTVNGVNQAPSFNITSSHISAEDAGLQSIRDFATAISPGPASEANQSINFIISNNNNSLFSIPPAIDATGRLTYTSAADRNGVATVTVQIRDNGGTAFGGVDTSAPKTFTITVTSVNDGPDSADDSYMVAQDRPLVVTAANGLLANDNDSHNGAPNENNTPITIGAFSGPLNGVIVLNSNGSFTYTPDLNFVGDDGFTYQALDGLQTPGNYAFVTFHVGAVNQAPTFVVGPNQVSVEDAGVQTVDAFIPEFSPGPASDQGQTIDFQVNNNNNALFSQQPAIDATGRLTYRAASDRSGLATVTVRIHDNGGTDSGGVDTSAPQAFTITVTAVNDAPTAVDDAYATNRGQQLVINASAGVLLNDNDLHGTATDESNLPLTAALVNNATHGTVTLAADGSFLYVPEPGYSGPDSFTYQAVDSLNARSTTATVRIDVRFSNRPPVAVDGSLSTPEDTEYVGTLVSSDPDNDPPTYLVVQPVHGTVVITDQATGAFTYKPQQDYNGPDQFSFRVNDGLALSNVATILITVTPTNDAPVASDQAFVLQESAPAGVAVGFVMASDIDANDTRTFAIASGNSGDAFAIDPVSGLITVNSSAALDFETSPVFGLVVTVTDATGAQATANVTINLIDVNDPLQLNLPSAAANFYTRRGPVIVDAAANAVDPDGPPVDFSNGRLSVRISQNAQSNDRLGIVDQGNGPGLLDVQGKTIVFDGRNIGKITNSGKGSSELAISFTSMISERAVNALLKLITFNNTDSFPSGTLRTVTFTLSDASGSRSATNIQTVQILGEPAARAVLLDSTSLTYFNGKDPAVIDPTATVTGPNDLGFDGATLSVKVISGSSKLNRIGIAAVEGITVLGRDVYYSGYRIGRATFGNNSLSVKLAGSYASVSAVQALLHAVTFATLPENTNLNNRTVSFRLTEVSGAKGPDAIKPIFVIATAVL